MAPPRVQAWLLSAALVLGSFATAAAIPMRTALCAPLSAKTPEAAQQRQAAMVRAVNAHLQGMRARPIGQALVSLPACIRVLPLRGAPDDVAVIRSNVEALRDWPGLLAYRTGEGGRVEPLQQEGMLLEPHLAYRDPVLKLVASSHSSGSGAYGRLQLYRLGATLDVLWEGPAYEHYTAKVLDSHWAVTLFRDRLTWTEPHALFANCCLPVDSEALWERQGDRFVPRGERRFPDPYRAVSMFVGALKKGDRALARRWAVSDAVVQEAAAHIDQIDPSGWGSMDRYWSVGIAEALAWDAIPGNLRGPGSGLTRLVWPAGRTSLVVERLPEGWRVSATNLIGDR